MKRNTQWLNGVVLMIQMMWKEYSVLTHEIWMKVINMKKQMKVIGSIKAVNAVLHSELDILQLTWLRKAINEGKAYSSLTVKTANAAMADHLINEGMIKGHDLKTCKLYHRGCRVIQCFICQQYDHIKSACKGHSHCGYCVQEHNIRDCITQVINKKAMCVMCRQKSHKTWLKKCSVREKKKQKTQKRFLLKLRYYKAEHNILALMTQKQNKSTLATQLHDAGKALHNKKPTQSKISESALSKFSKSAQSDSSRMKAESKKNSDS